MGKNVKHPKTYFRGDKTFIQKFVFSTSLVSILKIMYTVYYINK